MPGPGVSHVLEIPPDPQQGGEWQLLVAKLQAWWASGDLQSLWLQSRRPLTLLVGLLVALAVLEVGSSVLEALGSVPLLPGLLELVGLIWVLRHGVPRLLRSQDRDRLLSEMNQRWRAFRGSA
ncbi:MAG: hypothetical protein RLZZ336_1659 [Cyanobacteriota bacterium]